MITHMKCVDQITMRTLSDFLYHYAFRLRRPVMIWGVMGVGKSDGVRQFAARINALLIDVRLGTWESIDLRGMPDVDREKQTSRWLRPEALPFKGNEGLFPTDRPIILFLDEINGAQRGTSGAAYQLVRDLKVGEHELMDNVIVIAAGNRESDKGVTERQPAPLSNRFIHVEVVPSVSDTNSYIIQRKLPVEMTAFLSWQPDMICTFDAAKNEKAFATPRSIIEALEDYIDPDTPEELKWIGFGGRVGRGWAASYRGFLTVYAEMRDMMPQIMQYPDTAPIPGTPDKAYAIATNIGGQMTKANVSSLWRYVKRLNVEFCILAWQLAMKLDDTIDQTPEFIEYGALHRATLQGI